MAYAYVQEAQNTTGATSATGLSTGNFGSANTAGNLIVVGVSYDGNGTSSLTGLSFTVTDTLGNTYTLIDTVSDTTNGYRTALYYAKNIAGGTNSVSAQFNSAPASTYYKGVFAAEYSGLDTVAPFTAGQYNGQEQTSSTGAANELTSGNTPALAQQPCAVIGFSTILHSVQGPPSAGTGFTQRAQFWNYGNAATFACLEDMRVTSTSAIAATFTPAGTGQKFANFVVVFNETGASGGGAALASTPSDATTTTGTLGIRHVVANMVEESTTTSGTSPFSLGGALTGFQSFGTVMSDQDTCLYLAQAVTGGAPNGPWEIGIGTYNLSTNSLSRTQVLKSSNGNAAVSFPLGTTYISLTEPAEALWNKGVFNAGNSGSAITIDWSKGPYQMVTLTANATITFVNSMLCPHGELEIYQDATGGRVPTITGAVYRSGSPPTWSTTNATHDTLDIHYNVVTGKSNVFART